MNVSDESQRPTLGVGLMSAATLGFAGMTVMVKLMDTQLPEPVLVFWRGLFALPLILVMVLRARRPLVVANKWSIIRRSLFGAAAMMMFFYALGRLTLAEAGILIRLQPIWVALLAPFVVGERPGGRVWWALAASVVGAGLVLGPSLSTGVGVLSIAGLAALAASLFSSLAHLELRRLGRTEQSDVVVLNFTVLLVLISGFLSLPVGQVPEPSHWLLLVALGFFATVGQFLMTKAYKAAPAPLVATVGYVSLPVAALLDWGLFQTSPTKWTVVGGLLIIAAGLALAIQGRSAKSQGGDQRPPVVVAPPAIAEKSL